MNHFNLRMTLLLVAACSPAMAATIDINTNARSAVFLDGAEMGNGSMLLDGVPNGNHQLRVEDPKSGAVKTFDMSVESPTDSKKIDVRFSRIGSEIDESGAVHTRVVVAVGTDGHIQQSRNKVRTRNVALGAAVVVPVVGVGVAIVNELFNK